MGKFKLGVVVGCVVGLSAAEAGAGSVTMDAAIPLKGVAEVHMVTSAGQVVPAGGRAVAVLVLDGRGQPVAGAQVVARLEVQPSELGSAPTARPARPTSASEPVGELGVLRGPLPFPEEIISGTYLMPGALQRGSSDAGGVTATTDSKGSARLYPVPPGRVQLLATLDAKSAAAEIIVPAMPPAAAPESEATALRIVLRLGVAPESLCTLPPEPGDAPEPLTPASEGPEVAGRVEDGRGFPVGGARLELTYRQFTNAQAFAANLEAAADRGEVSRIEARQLTLEAGQIALRQGLGHSPCMLGQAAATHGEIQQAHIHHHTQPHMGFLQRPGQRHPGQHRRAPGQQAGAPVAAQAPQYTLDPRGVATETHQRMKTPRLAEKAVEEETQQHGQGNGKQGGEEQGEHGIIKGLLHPGL